MSTGFNLVQQLTGEELPERHVMRTLSDFAHEFGWNPSDRIYRPNLYAGVATGHLLVEHGLENSAAISFLRNPHRYSSLNAATRVSLVSLSFNNLVDWHIQVDRKEVTYVYNRSNLPTAVKKRQISWEDLEPLRSSEFLSVIADAPRPSSPALDTALLETISHWRRRLSSELDCEVSTETLSKLLNAIILLRALEDTAIAEQGLRLREETAQQQTTDRLLVRLWDDNKVDTNRTLAGILRMAGRELDAPNDAASFLDSPLLGEFNGLTELSVRSLLLDFYSARNTPYQYDFSIMSRHALSRIYEHYVSYLQLPRLTGGAIPLFKRYPEEVKSKGRGTVYTPQFIARFFVRYVYQHIAPQTLRQLKAIDPACGSGIFLRALLEEQCSHCKEWVTTEYINEAFSKTMGIDIDENACNATELSLSLLHLSLTNGEELGRNLPIECSDAIDYFVKHAEMKGTFDVVVANPPFVDLETQSEELRSIVRKLLGRLSQGRTDLCYAFVYMATQLLNEEGLGLFILPRSFLVSASGRLLRDHLLDTTYVRLLADISAIKVFPETGTYPILLVFQKKAPIPGRNDPACVVLKCQELVARALNDVLLGKRCETPLYSVYEIPQSELKGESWLVPPPSEAALGAKLRHFRPLEDFMLAREGFISGADDILIIERKSMPLGEEDAYISLLRDREMQRYVVPTSTSKVFFYPYSKGVRMKEEEVRDRFPDTWQHLMRNRRSLEERSPVIKGEIPWWRPTRPRTPQNMLRPKIVTPHLVLVPRFSLDAQGLYGVSRAPFLYPADESISDDEILRFYLAVLNSSACYWHIMRNSHTYDRGYVMLEPRTIKVTPVPDIKDVPQSTLLRILGLVDKRVATQQDEAAGIEQEIDGLIADLYGLLPAERSAIGMD